MGEKRSFGSKINSASTISQGKIPPYVPKAESVERSFAATVVLRPSWLKAEHEDAYLLGMLLKLMTTNPGEMKTRSEICRHVFGREVVSDDEDKKLNRAMWELHRLGIIKLHNLEVG